MSLNISPIIQEVTTQEAQQGGAGAKKELTNVQKKKLDNFVKAWGNQAPSEAAESENSTSQANRTATPDGPQVDAYEQASAVAARGRTEEVDRKEGQADISAGARLRSIYRLMVTRNDGFLYKDLASLKQALLTKGKCLVDLAKNLSPQQAALRKYLLAELLVIQVASGADDEEGLGALLEDFRTNLMAEHGDFIRSTLEAYELGHIKPLQDVSLLELIDAYQIKEDREGLLGFFKMLRRRAKKKTRFIRILREMEENFEKNLEREQEVVRTEVVRTRQHFILNRLNQLRLLMKAWVLHQKFLLCCEHAKLSNLPDIDDLIEVCLQATASPEMLAGINGLVRLASVVEAEHKPGRNIFITNYNKLVLKNDLMYNVYTNPFQRKQVVDGIDKNLKAQGVLSVRAGTVG